MNHQLPPSGSAINKRPRTDFDENIDPNETAAQRLLGIGPHGGNNKLGMLARVPEHYMKRIASQPAKGSNVCDTLKDLLEDAEESLGIKRAEMESLFAEAIPLLETIRTYTEDTDTFYAQVENPSLVDPSEMTELHIEAWCNKNSFSQLVNRDSSAARYHFNIEHFDDFWTMNEGVLTLLVFKFATSTYNVNPEFQARATAFKLHCWNQKDGAKICKYGGRNYSFGTKAWEAGKIFNPPGFIEACQAKVDQGLKFHAVKRRIENEQPGGHECWSMTMPTKPDVAQSNDSCPSTPSRVDFTRYGPYVPTPTRGVATGRRLTTSTRGGPLFGTSTATPPSVARLPTSGPNPAQVPLRRGPLFGTSTATPPSVARPPTNEPNPSQVPLPDDDPMEEL